MELIVTLHGKHAATLDAADDRWLHAQRTTMGAMSAHISAAWTEMPETRKLDFWLDGCLPENGLLARYRARAQSMLQAAGAPCETPTVAEILWANADAEFAGAIRFDTDRTGVWRFVDVPGTFVEYEWRRLDERYEYWRQARDWPPSTAVTVE